MNFGAASIFGTRGGWIQALHPVSTALALPTLATLRKLQEILDAKRVQKANLKMEQTWPKDFFVDSDYPESKYEISLGGADTSAHNRDRDRANDRTRLSS